MKFELPQIEADVVIVLLNPDMGTLRMYPLWECGMAADSLQQTAAQWALNMAEHDGGGYVEVTIFDHRPSDRGTT